MEADGAVTRTPTTTGKATPSRTNSTGSPAGDGNDTSGMAAKGVTAVEPTVVVVISPSPNTSASGSAFVRRYAPVGAGLPAAGASAASGAGGADVDGWGNGSQTVESGRPVLSSVGFRSGVGSTPAISSARAARRVRSDGISRSEAIGS